VGPGVLDDGPLVFFYPILLAPGAYILNPPNERRFFKRVFLCLFIFFLLTVVLY